ncbi:MAG: DUF433 domain-containing protein [Hormoscilla sp. SP5CHS1]|nr:DUF433 domain-containing protein [Hormoscilla sp. SP12CHS1]MBC6452940.1 DUF433 domain-containing protein [Hormoscilla sp. SP5CHS1]MBC6479632.1 DUF433 domain-containing protein [Hormoscilla sp. GM7CHS1pb]MBO1349953.1 DUF433 domain-containing protein [Hormoscilla sp. GUM202]
MTLAIVTEPAPLEMHPDGIIRVGKTRVTLDTVIAAFLEGVPASEIVDRYPSLQLADVYFAIGYYLRHKEEVDAYITEREKIAAEIRQEAERRFSPVGIRDRLLARRNQHE